MTKLTDNEKTDKKEQLRQALCTRIMTMALAPNAVIDEVALETEFGVSRSPIREIIRQLSAEGYIELEQNRSPRVAPMSYTSLRMFFQSAPLIYIATTKLACLSPRHHQVGELKRLQNELIIATQNGDTVQSMLLNIAFHLHIGEMAENVYLMPSLKRLSIDHARLSMTFYRRNSAGDLTEDTQTALDQHELIIQAIEQGNAEWAGELITAHWELSKKRMMDFVMPEQVDIPIAF